jgi:hypothetical protein
MMKSPFNNNDVLIEAIPTPSMIDAVLTEANESGNLAA